MNQPPDSTFRDARNRHRNFRHRELSPDRKEEIIPGKTSTQEVHFSKEALLYDPETVEIDPACNRYSFVITPIPHDPVTSREHLFIHQELHLPATGIVDFEPYRYRSGIIRPIREGSGSRLRHGEFDRRQGIKGVGVVLEELDCPRKGRSSSTGCDDCNRIRSPDDHPLRATVMTL